MARATHDITITVDDEELDVELKLMLARSPDRNGSRQAPPLRVVVKFGADYAGFVTLDGKAPKGVEATDNQICIEGLNHGQRYRIAFRPGLPSSVEESLEARVELDIYVQDRSASVRFTGLIKEDPAGAPESFSELWHLQKPIDGSSGWLMAGIQQD